MAPNGIKKAEAWGEGLLELWNTLGALGLTPEEAALSAGVFSVAVGPEFVDPLRALMQVESA